jgi:CRP-like cAMP-binding protein
MVHSKKTPHPDAFVPSVDQTIGKAFVKHLSLFGTLSKSDTQALLNLNGKVGIVEKGDDLLHAGDKPTNVVVVLSGMLQRYTIDIEGKRQIHSFYLASDIPSMEGLHIPVMDNTLSAVMTSRVALVSHADMFSLFEAHTNIASLCWRETLVQASIFRQWLARNSQMLAHAQTAHLFCELMTRAVAAGLSSGETLELPLTQQDLADATGMSVVHANRTLQMLRSSGKVEFKDGILIIKDFHGLAELAAFDPSYLHLQTSA